MLKGYKTYVVGVVAIITTIGAYLTGDITIAQACQAALTAVLGMTIKSAIVNK